MIELGSDLGVAMAGKINGLCSVRQSELRNTLRSEFNPANVIIRSMTYDPEPKRTAIRAFMARNIIAVAPWEKAAGLGSGTLRKFLDGPSKTITDETLAKLAVGASALLKRAVTEAEFREQAGEHATEPLPYETAPAPNAPERPYRGDWRVDVPVMGTTVGGDQGDFEMNGEVAFHVPRPPRYTGRRDIFALIVQGTSMSPWREPGALVYVEGSRPPRNGEYVVIELKPRHGDTVRPTFLKKLTGRTPTKLRLLQFEPRREFDIELSKVVGVYRVIETDEFYGA